MHVKQACVLIVGLFVVTSCGLIEGPPEEDDDPVVIANNGTNNRVTENYCDGPAPDRQVTLSLHSMQQWCTQWCWAAVATNTANYFGTTMEDSYGNRFRPRECILASMNVGYRDWSACCQYGACQNAGCDRPVPANGIGDVLQVVGLHFRQANRALSEEEIRTEIANGRPVIVGFQSAFSGHVALITGYTPGSPYFYRVDDPWPYTGMGATRFEITYDQIRGGPGGSTPWVISWYDISDRADGCVTKVNPDCSCDTSDNQSDTVCGDGVCAESERGDCPDCPGVTPEYDCFPPTPIDCGDGCWPEGTDCESEVFECGGEEYRCTDPFGRANCCRAGNREPEFVTCPQNRPFYCAWIDTCVEDPKYCSKEPDCDYQGHFCRDRTF